MAQREPFQRSASVLAPSPSGRLYHAPTAIQALPETHDTANSEVPRAPGWVGIGWIDQAPPVQRSTSADVEDPLAGESPTATHTVRDGHETPDNCP
jgi:hypothetical protein